MKPLILFTLAASLWAAPQDIHFPAGLEALEEVAEEVVDITLDANMLGFATAFMSEDDPEEKAAKEVVKGLGGVYVRSYQFSEEGRYSMSDVEAIRSQLKAPEWTPIVNVRSKKPDGESAQIFVRKVDGKIAGLTVLAAEPKELTIVHIVGSLDPAQLASLGGQFGIPDMQMSPSENKEQ